MTIQSGQAGSKSLGPLVVLGESPLRGTWPELPGITSETGPTPDRVFGLHWTSERRWSRRLWVVLNQ